MDIGRNNRRVELQRRVQGRTPSGQPTDGWETVARPYARPLGQSGREAMAAGKETATRQVSLRIRYRTGITAAWRVIYDGQIGDITAVLPDEAGREHVDLLVEIGASRG
ncbi:phage head closure protein [Ralstonia solanacearum]|uniref:phage head closure protein n=1 Tax=Ralstonia solanacearum TaxID=305 RepID=UPI001E299BDC|nr:phage head closure protein [Ralstonia solanacearum]